MTRHKTRRRIPIFIRGEAGAVGTILAPPDSPGFPFEHFIHAGDPVVLERQHDKVVRIVCHTLRAAESWPGFQLA